MEGLKRDSDGRGRLLGHRTGMRPAADAPILPWRGSLMRRTLSVLAAFLLTLAWPQARALADVPIPEIDTPLSDAALEINTTGTGNNDYLIDLTGVSAKFFA